MCDIVFTNDSNKSIDELDVVENGHLWKSTAPSTVEHRLRSVAEAN